MAQADKTNVEGSKSVDNSGIVRQQVHAVKKESRVCTPLAQSSAKRGKLRTKQSNS